MNEETLRAGTRLGTLSAGWTRRRWARTGAEVAYDTGAWICGLGVGAAATHDLIGLGATGTDLARATLALCLLAPTCGLLAGLYRGRHLRGSLDEVVGIGRAAAGAGLVLLIAGEVVVPGQRAPRATVAAGTAVAVVAMLGARHLLFAVRQRSRAPAPSAVNVIVFGAGGAGAQLVHRMTSEPDSPYRPVALLDDDPDKRRLRIQGVPVLGDRTRIAQVAAVTGARVLVIAVARPGGTVIRDITAAAEHCGLTPKVVPSLSELLSGGARIEGVRDPRITDLLGRRPVDTDVAAVARHVEGKRVLVTGAGGSIGSELCRQLHRLRPAELIMLDRDESALHAVQLSLHGRALLDSGETVLADIRDPARMREVFQEVQPHIVFHAAALKHLPLLEQNPAEAVKTNVRGSLAVLEAAAECGVESLVNISTDKAADPVSVLGYSKRVAERLTANLASQTGRAYLSVRFGNVLGSRGSVLTALSAQVAAGGPVTITHPDVTRYFMTADEAVQLVLQASVIGRGGEVLVLDMGDPVRIADIARRLVADSGRQIEILYTGLRPGEKLHEDLLGTGEPDERPRHPLIRHAPVPPITAEEAARLNPGAPPGEVTRALARASGGAAPPAAGAAADGPRVPVGRPDRRESAAEPLARSR